MAILPADVTATGLRTNWYGRFSKLQDVFPKLAENDIFSGIPGSPTEHHGTPFTLTEEFVSVYRMHPLMPDHFTIRSSKTDEALAMRSCPSCRGGAASISLPASSRRICSIRSASTIPAPSACTTIRSRCRTWCRTTASASTSAPWTSSAIASAACRATTASAACCTSPRSSSFEELTDNPQWAEEMKRVYDNDIEKVDTMVGMMAEPLPPGLGFSDTAFRVFL